MNKIAFFLIILMLYSCSENPESYIKHLNGYWEIDEVTLPDGSKRDYNFNDTIDYIEVTNSMTGFRKKVKPNLGGTYSASDDAESFKLVVEDKNLNIYYKTPYAEWKETVMEATENGMIVKNQDGIVYVYKRYEPIMLE